MLMSRRSTPRILAVAALGVAAVIVILLVRSAGAGRYELVASFDQVNGLIPGARVTAGGVAVGKVSDIKLDRSGYPLVRMRVDDDFPVRAGTLARVRPSSVSGEVSRVVDLVQGSGARLRSGAVLSRRAGGSVQEFDQVLSTLDPGTRAATRRTLAAFDRATTGRGRDIEASLATSAEALQGVADIARGLRGDGDAIRGLVASTNKVAATIAQQPAPLASFVDRLNGLLKTTASRQQELAATFEAAPHALDAGTSSLARLGRSVGVLETLVAAARPGTAQLRSVAPDLRVFAGAAPKAAAQLRRLTAEAPGQLRRIDPLLSDAGVALRALTPALGGSVDIFNELRARLPDAFGFVSHWADFSANYDANGHGARIGLVLANPPRNTIGPDDSGPGQLARPFLRLPGALEGEPWTDYRKSLLEPTP
jgi:phospholipid/cholesterol/gamma-HCH transport system substrate-binding protein